MQFHLSRFCHGLDIANHVTSADIRNTATKGSQTDTFKRRTKSDKKRSNKFQRNRTKPFEVSCILVDLIDFKIFLQLTVFHFLFQRYNNEDPDICVISCVFACRNRCSTSYFTQRG